MRVIDLRKVNVYNSTFDELQGLIDNVGGEIKEHIENRTDKEKEKWADQFSIYTYEDLYDE